MVERNNKGQFVVGHKGVPGVGRPAGSKSVQNYVMSISNNLEDYINMLDEIVRDPETKINERIGCLKELLDRGAGRATQAIHQTGDLSIVIGGLPEDLDV